MLTLAKARSQYNAAVLLPDGNDKVSFSSHRIVNPYVEHNLPVCAAVDFQRASLELQLGINAAPVAHNGTVLHHSTARIADLRVSSIDLDGLIPCNTSLCRGADGKGRKQKNNNFSIHIPVLRFAM